MLLEDKACRQNIYRISHNKNEKAKLKNPSLKQKTKMAGNQINKWIKDLRRHFTKQKIQMAKNKHEKAIQCHY